MTKCDKYNVTVYPIDKYIAGLDESDFKSDLINIFNEGSITQALINFPNDIAKRLLDHYDGHLHQYLRRDYLFIWVSFTSEFLIVKDVGVDDYKVFTNRSALTEVKSLTTLFINYEYY